MKYGKLVRDRIPEIIEANGATAVTRTLDTAEYIKSLLDKVVEEATELRDSPVIEERADLHEVLKALDKAAGFSEEDIATAARDKASTNGAFEDRIYLERVED